jgi:hypothetical protein
MGKNLKLDQIRPDLEIGVQMPGAFVIRDGKAVPDLNDSAMAKREELKKENQKPVQDEGNK